EERAEAERRAANWKRVAVSVVALFTLLVVAAGGWGMAWLANQRQRAEAQKVETERQLAYVRAREELQQGRDPKRALAYLARHPDPGDSTPRQLILADAVEQGIPVAAFRDHGQVSVSAVAVEAGTSLVLSGDERGRVLA